MIDTVRRTVLSILNKENNGYITPDQFNLYARQAQLEIFEQYFYDLNSAESKSASRLYNSGHGDIKKRMEFVIDKFSVFQHENVYFLAESAFVIPDNCYSTGTVTLSDGVTDVDIISHSKSVQLLSSLDTSPTESFPVAVVHGSYMKVYPTTLNQDGDIKSTYVRYPKDPVWTYTTVSGDPLFDASSSSYQDFELPKDDESDLIRKILLYCGVEIREPQVIEFAKREELQEKQEQK